MNDPVRRATEIQRLAAAPGTSVAVRASAGSGKTSVLIDRFVRLCVEGPGGGVHPRSILAITFTRKAATEIRERLLDRARSLALGEAPERRGLLASLFDGREAGPPTAAEEDRAARLYERLLEDPSGLQVGTIHSFCQRILARFATEAGLDPHAALLEDREELLDEALDRVLVAMAADPDLGALAADLGSGPQAVRGRLREVLTEQMRVDRWLRRIARRADLPARPRLALLPGVLAELRAYLWPGETVGEGITERDLQPALQAAARGFANEGLAAAAAGFDAAELKRLKNVLEKLQVGSLAAALTCEEGEFAPAHAACRKLVLTQAGTVRKFTTVKGETGSAFNAAVTEAAGPLLAVLRSIDLVGLYRRNRAQLALGLRALDACDDLKRRDRVIDFGDLEDFAVVLMGDEARALSLLFRLEDSISHILVDEFQDTNFNQRDILRPFVAEFLAGGSGAGATPPTVFFVGDMKQSIYGFRGAEPSIFAEVMAGMAERDLPVPTLPTNFRSLPAVVDGTGILFRTEPLVSRLPAGEADHVHQAVARGEDPGLLVTLDAYEAEDTAPEGRTARQVAADAAARIARELVDGGATTWEGWGASLRERPLRWSDLLVLYRSRTAVSLYEQAFRAAGIPIEPAGRGMLAASREVQDLLALLRWLTWTDDDVALATVLRSPLFRLPEALFQGVLAARGLFRSGQDGRRLPPGRLWSALRDQRGADPRLEAAAAHLEAWRADTGFVGCPELLRRIYREGEVLARYTAAGGAQARINLERLHDLALGSEVAGTPTVRRLVDLVDRAGRRGGQDEGTAGRDGGDGRVRFMTIHGAKGLEAPVVLLVDADHALRDRTSQLRLDPRDSDSGLVFGVTKGLRVPGEAADDLLTAAGEAAVRAADIEETNLLYVAMTRARDRLYVLGARSGAADRPGEPPPTPLRRLRAAAAAAPTAPVGLADPEFLERPPAPAQGPPAQAQEASETVGIWTPPVLGERHAVVTPSSAGEEGTAVTAPVHPGAVEHGLRVHLLLQLAVEQGALPPGQGEAHAEAAAVLADPRLAWLFDPATVAGLGHCEAPVILRRAGAGAEERVTGVIDRLVVRADRIDVIDYKTNRWGGDPERKAWLREHYRAQLTAYGEAAAALFPGRTVRTWLLLTDPAGRSESESGLCEIV